MDTDKAYLLGLIIGGGVFGGGGRALSIRLPYRKWGSYLENPRRAGQIAGDLLKKVQPMFRAVYDLSIQYDATPGGTWIIRCEGDVEPLRQELAGYGIRCEGELRETADIGKLAGCLVDDNMKRRFVAGLADTIGSMARSHRRFNDEHQIISFEIKGGNYRFVCALCRLLYGIGCIPDQVNWNHPNIHCANDPYYKAWNKGFKLRILLDQYARFGAFAFRTKAESTEKNLARQRGTHAAEKCETRRLNVTPSAVHPAENDPRLPAPIRGGHYIHFSHFCAVLGCPHAPVGELRRHLADAGKLISPFPILCKGPYPEIMGRLRGEPLLAERKYRTASRSLKGLLDAFAADPGRLLYGDSGESGYPLAEILQGAAYVLARDGELFGRRPRKSFRALLEKRLEEEPALRIRMRLPDLLTPLALVGNGRAALVGPRNPAVYAKLVTRSPDNEFKISVRRITEKDLRHARGEK